MALPQELKNALRQRARLYLAEMLQRIDGDPAASRDAIVTEVLDKHVAQLPAMLPGTITPKSWLVYYVRLLRKESTHGA